MIGDGRGNLTLLLVVAGAIFAVAYGALIALHLRRRRRFAGRPVLSFPQWCARYGVAGGPVIEKVLQDLARAMWVKPTQLLPADRFDVEFSYAPLWTMLPNRAVEDFIDNAAEILWYEGVMDWPRFKIAGKMLGDLLDNINGALAAAKEHAAPHGAAAAGH